MEKKVLVLLAEGFEEMEAVITSDLCIRAGLDVCTAGLDGIDVTGSHGLSLIADCELVDVDFNHWCIFRCSLSSCFITIIANQQLLCILLNLCYLFFC